MMLSEKSRAIVLEREHGDRLAEIAERHGVLHRRVAAIVRVATQVVNKVELDLMVSRTGRWDLAGRCVQDAGAGPGEGGLLDGNVVDDVEAIDVDVCVRERCEPAGVELDAGRLSLTAHPALRPERDVAGE
jgi:hypothetical protein